MAGPDRHLFEALMGKEDADVWIAVSEQRSVVVAQGQLRPGHLRAQKP